MQKLQMASTLGRKMRPHLTIWIIAAAVLVFLTWATFAPLEIIVRGDGRVVPSMNTQVIQNLEGGIVQEVFVVEGDEVAANDRLLQMDPTQFQSSVQELLEQRLALLIEMERLRAERDSEADFEPSSEYGSLAPEYAASEMELFAARRERLTTGLAGATELAKLRQEKVDLLRPMVARDAVPKIELIRAQQEAVESAARVEEIRTEFEAQRAESYSKALVDLRQVEEQLRAKQDQLDRTEVISPVRGIVNRVSVSTVGGVVRSGEELIEILPLDQPLRIEGRIDPRDIGFVFSGMDASIKLTAFDFAVYGSLKGRVVHVGADTVVDEDAREPKPYYEVFIELVETSLSGPQGSVDIRPGMQAVVELDAGDRTVLQYLLKPLFKASEALHER